MKKTLIKILSIFIALFVIIALLSGVIVDFQWFKEVGYIGVFFTSIKAKIILFIPIFILLLIIINFYVRYLRRGYLNFSDEVYDAGEIKKQNNIITIISIIMSFVISLMFTNLFWYRILEFYNAVDFNVKDPIFNLDAGFYVFKLPLIEALLGILITIVIMLIVIALLFYGLLKIRDGYAGFREYLRGKESPLVRFVTRQISIFGAVLLILLSGVFYTRALNLVYSPRGAAFGASYTDVHVTLPMYRIIAAICLAASIFIAYSIAKKKLKWITYTGIFIVVLIISETLISGIVEKLIVSPNAREKELPYLKYNIELTREAFGLNKIVEKNFPVKDNLTEKDLEGNKNTVENIRINEFSQSLEVFNQIQAIRNYYKFNDVDIDRYLINGKLTQVFIAARELDNSAMDLKYQNWQNNHLFYTHGYGAVMAYTNRVSSTGLPEFIIRDMPIDSNGFKIEKPQIYFGEINDQYIIVGGNNKEMDYPSGNKNEENKYDGTAGIKMTAMNRVLFAINKGDISILLSNNINSNSKMIMHRNILQRVRKIAPFINYDNDPYLVTLGGRVYWIIDGYTTTGRFPFSEQYSGINYIRNSVKVVIDAYDGTTNFYICDNNDAMAKTIGKIYKGLFKDISEMPSDLRSHLRYSEDVFSIQSRVYEKYHMVNPIVFYNSQDLWSVSKYKGADGKETNVEPVYQIMKLPGENKEEFLLAIPFTAAKKENMVSWLAVRMDEANLSQMLLVRFSSGTAIYGPQQFNSKINTDTSISSQLTLWGQKGSQVILGETYIIPIDTSLVYVRPLYLRAEGGKSLPELKKVIVGYGDRIVMEDNIEKAFLRLFKVDIEKPEEGITPPSETKTAAELANRAGEIFNKAKEAQRNGDWAAYGQYLKELEDILIDLKNNIK